MYTKFFSIPKAVYFYGLFPIITIIIFILLFSIIYHRKKGTYYYVYNMNYIYSVSGILFLTILIPIIEGYALAIYYVVTLQNVFADYNVLVIVMMILPVFLLILLLYMIFSFAKNIKLKRILDEQLDSTRVNKIVVE